MSTTAKKPRGRPRKERQSIGANFGPPLDDLTLDLKPEPEPADPLAGLDSKSLVDPAVLETLPQLLARDNPELAAGRDHLLKKLSDWVDGHSYDKSTVSIADDMDCGRTGDLIDEIRDFINKDVEPVRVSAKEPVNKAADAVQAFFVGTMKVPLDAATAPLKQARTAYLADVEDRKRDEIRQAAKAKMAEAETLSANGLEAAARSAEEDAERLEMEAETAKSTDLTRVHGVGGSVASLSSKMDYTVDNMLDVIMAIISNPTQYPVQLVTMNDSLVKLMINAKKNPLTKIPGLNIFPRKNAK